VSTPTYEAVVEALAAMNAVFDDLAVRLGVADQPKEPSVLADAIEALKMDAAHAELRARELAEMLRERNSTCSCRGTGTFEISCGLCGDSTFDHECTAATAPCNSDGCERARALLAASPDSDTRLREVMEKAWERGREYGTASLLGGKREQHPDMRRDGDIDEVLRGGA
jgi:hypothetical protein